MNHGGVGINSTRFWDGPEIYLFFLLHGWKSYPSYTEISFGRERERKKVGLKKAPSFCDLGDTRYVTYVWMEGGRWFNSICYTWISGEREGSYMSIIRE